MKKLLLICFLLVLSNASHAVTDFTGDYAVSNWTQVTDGGLIGLTAAPYSISLTSSDAAEFVAWTGGWSSNQDFTIMAQTNGWIGFNWSFFSTDCCGPTDKIALMDPFGTLLNGVFTRLTNDAGGNSQSGVAQFAVAAGDVFGFRANSFDSCCGTATTTISNFSVVAAPVPEPETYAMLLAGLGLLGFTARRRNGVSRQAA